MNSMKMKLSVIIGVSHMSLGIFIKAINSRYFYKSIDFFCEFIPQITLLTVTFGYMNLLIIIKWLTNYKDTSEAPSIIATMIDMALGFGMVEQTPLIGSRTTHETVNILILLTALLCVPAMLFIKPILLTQEIKRKEASKRPGAIELGVCSFSKRKMSAELSDDDHSGSDDEEGQLIKKDNGLRRRFKDHQSPDRRSKVYNPDDDPLSEKNEEKKDEAREKLVNSTKGFKPSESHSTEEIWIHQLIETIEFVLGCISNTASYLRLWALSLAHSQLSAVFYDKLIKSSVESANWFGLFLTLPFFLSANFFILICMDSMECFLHTLRLHWVEFQNKFYAGNGYKFLPFSLIESTGFKQHADN